MSPIDREAHLNRWRGKPLAEKLLLALGMLVLALVTPPWPGAGFVALVMTAATLLFARVSPKVWLACAAAPLGFLAVGAVWSSCAWMRRVLGWPPAVLPQPARLWRAPSPA
jgi:cobalt/nickel transport system permease protein